MTFYTAKQKFSTLRTDLIHVCKNFLGGKDRISFEK